MVHSVPPVSFSLGIHSSACHRDLTLSLDVKAPEQHSPGCAEPQDTHASLSDPGRKISEALKVQGTFKSNKLAVGKTS